MGAFITRFLYGETDVNGDGEIDRDQLIDLVNTYLKKQNERKSRKIIKKILRK
jgi:Ca2+-binding EF-hand superfamily protein